MHVCDDGRQKKLGDADVLIEEPTCARCNPRRTLWPTWCFGIDCKGQRRGLILPGKSAIPPIATGAGASLRSPNDRHQGLGAIVAPKHGALGPSRQLHPGFILRTRIPGCPSMCCQIRANHVESLQCEVFHFLGGRSFSLNATLDLVGDHPLLHRGACSNGLCIPEENFR